MRIALYRGTSPVSRAIRWMTRSQWSHAAFVFDEASAKAVESLTPACRGRLPSIGVGTTIEAWQGGMKCSPSISTLHTSGTVVDLFEFTVPLNAWEEEALVRWLAARIGAPYNYRDVLRFVTRRRGNLNGRLFCSEAIAQACIDIMRPIFRVTESWRVPPDWLGRTTNLRFIKTVVTVR